MQWWIRGGASGVPPLSPISFIFIKFSAKKLTNNRLVPDGVSEIDAPLVNPGSATEIIRVFASLFNEGIFNTYGNFGCCEKVLR